MKRGPQLNDLRPVLPAKCSPNAKGFHRQRHNYLSFKSYNKTHVHSLKVDLRFLKHMHFRLIQTRFTQLIATAKGNHSIKMSVSILEMLPMCPSFFFPSKCFTWKAQGFLLYFWATNSIFGKLTHDNFSISVLPYWDLCRRRSRINISPFPYTLALISLTHILHVLHSFCNMCVYTTN